MGEKTEFIVTYNGNINALAGSLGLNAEILNERYAIITASPEQQQLLNRNPQIEYMEEQKLLSFQDNPAITAAGITAVQQENSVLTGRGVLIAVLDTGIDYRHKDFRNPNGTTRIIRIWDQNAAGMPPAGFSLGAEYTREEINAALAGTAADKIPPLDQSGHGTALAGLAAGNGQAANGEYPGGAPEAALLIVSLKQTLNHFHTSDTCLMRGIQYAVDTASAMNMPLVITISCGSNQGAHDGSSLFEQYINDMADIWPSVIVIATGNEGVSGKHFQARLAAGNSVDAGFTVQGQIESLNITMLKPFAASLDIRIIDGMGNISEAFDLSHNQVITLGTTQILISPSTPLPASSGLKAELIFCGLSDDPLTATIWTIRIKNLSGTDTALNMWLPQADFTGANTAFLTPDANTSLTIPATVPNALSVGGYNSTAGTFAAFSGRGFTMSQTVKPEICAPAVSVIATAAGGGYASFTGTSYAAAITAGACAVMMQWGILEGNNSEMYGRQLKKFLESGARQHPGYSVYPNTSWGYGALYLKNALYYARRSS